MFPGYAVIFKDDDSFIHLYFFPGLDENDNFYYRDLDLSSSNVKYEKITMSDGASEYIFENKNIVKIVCRLIDNNGKLHIKELTL